MGDTPWICTACGTNYVASLHPPKSCPICQDERQFVPSSGQNWLQGYEVAASHRVAFTPLADSLTQLTMEPDFAIGHRSILVETPKGNLLWDCLPYFDDASLMEISRRGGLAVVAISHPHFYGAFAQISAAFGNCPVLLHAADAHWLQFPFSSVQHWTGQSHSPLPQLTLHHCGGHFPGSSVLEINGHTLLTGDTVAVSADRKSVSFMFSYPNRIPLGPSALTAIEQALRPLTFDALHSSTPGATISANAKELVAQSIARYRHAISK